MYLHYPSLKLNAKVPGCEHIVQLRSALCWTAAVNGFTTHWKKPHCLLFIWAPPRSWTAAGNGWAPFCRRGFSPGRGSGRRGRRVAGRVSRFNRRFTGSQRGRARVHPTVSVQRDIGGIASLLFAFTQSSFSSSPGFAAVLLFDPFLFYFQQQHGEAADSKEAAAAREPRQQWQSRCELRPRNHATWWYLFFVFCFFNQCKTI